MADADVVAQVYPFDDKLSLVKNAIENNPRYMPPRHGKKPNEDSRSSRATTEPPENVNDPNILPYLEVRFSHPPRSSLGLVFGTDASCDVVLPQIQGVSKRHFALTYKDQFADGYPRLILRDLGSSYGTLVMYDDRGKQLRSNFDWILDGFDIPGATKELIVQVNDHLKFRVIASHYNVWSPTYINNIKRFRQGAADPQDLFRGLGLQSGPATERNTGTHTPARGQPILLSMGVIGQGGFGIVSRHWNVSTGEEYACKQPLNTRHYDSRAWEKEIKIMKAVSHDNIIRLHFSRTSPSPFMYLEYMALGNLGDEHVQAPFSYEECSVILVQAASALKYLHERNDPVVHRDLKPENILVQRRDNNRDPDGLLIKLSDFGLSKIGNSLKTGCGSVTWCPPEISANHSGRKYTKAVDIWSLGVVILRFAYGLPHPGSGIGMHWCQKIVDEAHDWESEGLIDILQSMLVIDAQARCSAGACWLMASRLAVSSSSQGHTAAPMAASHAVQSSEEWETFRISPRNHHLPSENIAGGTLDTGLDLRWPSPSLVSLDDDPGTVAENSEFVRSQGPPASSRSAPVIDIAQQVWTESEQYVAATLLGFTQMPQVMPQVMPQAQPGLSGIPGNSEPQRQQSLRGQILYNDPAFQSQVSAPVTERPALPTSSPFSQTLPPAQAPLPAPVSMQAMPMPAPVQQYLKLKHAGKTIMYRSKDDLVNVTQLLTAIGYTKTLRWPSLVKKLGHLNKSVVYGRHIGGTYVSMTTVRSILQILQLSDAVVLELMRQIK